VITSYPGKPISLVRKRVRRSTFLILRRRSRKYSSCGPCSRLIRFRIHRRAKSSSVTSPTLMRGEAVSSTASFMPSSSTKDRFESQKFGLATEGALRLGKAHAEAVVDSILEAVALARGD